MPLATGIGAIFGAPLGGSILATEIMYRDDFEVEALLPAFIASIVGYAVWGSIEGFGPLFGYARTFHLTDASQLIWFAIIGILGGAVGRLYAKGFYGMATAFGRLPVPRWVKPAIGGLLVGCIGSISRAPLAVIIMVVEMTGTLSLLVPGMVAAGLATLIVRAAMTPSIAANFAAAPRRRPTGSSRASRCLGQSPRRSCRCRRGGSVDGDPDV